MLALFRQNAPALLRKAEAPAAPRESCGFQRGLVAPAEGSGATALRRMRSSTMVQRIFQQRREAYRKGTSSGATRHLPRACRPHLAEKCPLDIFPGARCPIGEGFWLTQQLAKSESPPLPPDTKRHFARDGDRLNGCHPGRSEESYALRRRSLTCP